MPRRVGFAVLVAGLLVAGCRLEQRPPGAARGEDAAIRDAVVAFYQSRNAADPAALALVAGSTGPARLLRQEVRQRDGLAMSWITVSGEDLAERNEVAVLRLRGDSVGAPWRVVALFAAPAAGEPR